MNLRLGVNIDHVATLRQVRGTRYPNPLEAAHCCAKGGAHSITVHLREDRRHIQDRDVYLLKSEGELPLNLEMGNSPDIVKVALDVKPAEICLVPERRMELTTEGGLDVAGQLKSLRPSVRSFQQAGIVVSLFIEADRRQIEAATELEVPFVELHTGTFCDASGPRADQELKRLVDGARLAHKLGLKVNAGHGINLDNIVRILAIPHLHTLNIGHSIVARALFVGLEAAVREMLERMNKYGEGKT